MIIKRIVVGDIQTNCYIAADEASREAAIIDPGGEAEAVAAQVKANKFIPRFIVSTHGHFDHVLAVSKLKKEFGIPFYIHSADSPMVDGSLARLAGSVGLSVALAAADRLLSDGDILDIGSVRLKVIHTPGHSRGCVCLYGEGVLFSGDTLFADDTGRTDLFGGSDQDMGASLKKLLALPDETKVYPGHGTSTDIKREKDNWRGRI